MLTTSQPGCRRFVHFRRRNLEAALLAATQPGSIDMPRVYAGLAETCIPVFVSFGFLAVSWLLIAAGMLLRTP